MSVPEGLREVLETLFAEDTSPDNLAIYLPKVHQIITNLLHGLCDKQSMYRRIVSEHQFHQCSSHSRTDSRSSRSDRTTSRREEETRHRSHCRQQARERGLRHVDRNRDSSIAPRASVQTSTKRPETQSRLTPPPFAEPDDDPPAAGDHCPVSAHMHANGCTDCSLNLRRHDIPNQLRSHPFTLPMTIQHVHPQVPSSVFLRPDIPL